MDRFVQTLPDDFYYCSLARQVLNPLTKGENVVVGGVYGCGVHTFLNTFSHLTKKDSFDQILTFSPQDLTHSEYKLLGAITGNNLVIIHSLNPTPSTPAFLEKLYQLRLPHNHLTYLIITDHNLVTRPYQYLGLSSPFFGSRYVVMPFDLSQTQAQININNQFFGWKTPHSLTPQIIELSGGIQRLTKHISKLVSEFNYSLDEPEKFFEDPSILFQLQMLTKIISQATKSHLSALGITNHSGQIKSKLLQRYLDMNYDQAVLQYFPTLTLLERKLFALLHQNAGSVVTLDQIADTFEILGCEFSLWAIYKLISRLKPKVSSQFTLKTIKGKGYLLTRL